MAPTWPVSETLGLIVEATLCIRGDAAEPGSEVGAVQARCDQPFAE